MRAPEPMTPEEIQALVRLTAKTPARRRYVLVRRKSGELVFEQDATDVAIDEAIAAAFGEPKPRRRVLRIDGQPRKNRAQTRADRSDLARAGRAP